LKEFCCVFEEKKGNNNLAALDPSRDVGRIGI
jgi:hypothetical protein